MNIKTRRRARGKVTVIVIKYVGLYINAATNKQTRGPGPGLALEPWRPETERYTGPIQLA